MHVKEIFDLGDRVAIVTGASSGLGVWFARGLAEAGAKVVLAARRLERLEKLATELQGLGVQAEAITTDVRDESQVERLARATVDAFGRIDILINNAGVGDDELSVDNMAMEEVRQRFEVNLFGLWQCCRHVGRTMLEQGNGKIINIASILGLRAGQLGPAAAYCSSKSAVIGMSRDLAYEWAGRGVKVHCVAPGLFRTELTARDLDNPEIYEMAQSAIPLGRIGEEDDIKALVVFLASSGGDFLIGHPIILDGGQLLGAF